MDAQNTNASSVLAVVGITTTAGEVKLNVDQRKPIFILGRNGAGKSALVHRIYLLLAGLAVYLPGSRPVYFEQEGLSMSPASRRQTEKNFLQWDRDPGTRWHAISGTVRNERAVHDLLAAEMQYAIDAAEEIRQYGKESAAIRRLQSDQSPLHRVNAIFAQSNLPVRLKIDGGELKTVRDDNVYSFARMSDGERVALVFASEVLTAVPGAVFVVDEPELHLHPAIVVPFVSSLIAERPDCGFVISTHVLDLPSAVDAAKAVLVRSVNSQNNQAQSWQIDIVEAASKIPESVHVDLLGSRKNILFIEGDENKSLDQPLYNILFPKVSVRPKESCREVVNAVKGLRSAEGLHRVKAYGLVDHDGLSPARVAELEAEGVFPLPIFSVESLYYCADVLRAVAIQQAETLGLNADELLSTAKEQALASLRSAAVTEHLASRLAERQMRDLLMEQMPGRKSMVSNGALNIDVSIVNPYPVELERLNSLVAQGDLDGIVSRYPVRESGILQTLAKALRLPGREDYERAALMRVRLNTELQDRLRGRLGRMALSLD